MMNRKDIKKFLMIILGRVDYDIAKSYDPKTAEEPEYANSQMEELIDVAEIELKKYQDKLAKKK